MTIRPASHIDLPFVTRIVANAYQPYVDDGLKPPGPMFDDYPSRIRQHTIWVSEDHRIIQGLIVLLPENDHLLLDNIAIDPAHQGKGVGRALMDFADQEALRRGYPELRLYTQQKMTKNIALYTTLGWTEIGRGEQAGFQRVFFRKPVNQP